MKKVVCFLIIICSVSILSLEAQEKEGLRVSAMGFYGVGLGIVDNKNAPNYNFRTTNFDVLVDFDFGKIIGFATGIGFSSLSGNGFNSTGDFYHERSLMKIPLLMSLTYPISKDFDFYANGGLFYEQIRDDEFQYLNTTEKDIYEGSSIGAQFQVGFLINLPAKVDWEGSRVGVLFGAQLSGEYDNGSNGALFNQQDLGDIYSFSVVYSYTF